MLKVIYQSSLAKMANFLKKIPTYLGYFQKCITLSKFVIDKTTFKRKSKGGTIVFLNLEEKLHTYTTVPHCMYTCFLSQKFCFPLWKKEFSAFRSRISEVMIILYPNFCHPQLSWNNRNKIVYSSLQQQDIYLPGYILIIIALKK